MDIGGSNNNYSGAPLAEMPSAQIPPGVGMSLAMSGYAGLTEAKKEEIIMRCKDVETKGQMQKVVDSLAPGMDIQEIYEEEKELFS